MQSTKKRIEAFLKDRSEIVYLYPSIACVIIFLVTIISSSVYITQKSNYKICVDAKPAESDYLREYILGSIIVGYIFLAIYSNILIEYIPQLKGLALSFILLFVWSIGSVVWNIIGISLVSKSHCTSNSYYGISILNLVVFFTSVFLLICYSIYVCVKRHQNPSQVQTAPSGSVPQDPLKIPSVPAKPASQTPTETPALTQAPKQV